MLRPRGKNNKKLGKKKTGFHPSQNKKLRKKKKFFGKKILFKKKKKNFFKYGEIFFFC